MADLPQPDGDLRQDLWAARRRDLAFTLARADSPGFDIWEEESGFHYFTQLIQAEALSRGAKGLANARRRRLPRVCATAAQLLATRLDALWDAGGGYYASRAGRRERATPARNCDISVVLGVILPPTGRSGPHSVLDPKARRRCSRWKSCSSRESAINRGAGVRGIAMGRYAGRCVLRRRRLVCLDAGGGGVLFPSRGGAGRPAPTCPRSRRTRASANGSGRKVRVADGWANAALRARGRIHGDGSRLHTRERRAFGAVRPGDRRADLGQATDLELRRIHYRRRKPGAGLRFHIELDRPCARARGTARPHVCRNAPNDQRCGGSGYWCRGRARSNRRASRHRPRCDSALTRAQSSLA